MRILSYEYLQWRARQLGALSGELDPHNLHRLLRALDRLEALMADLMEVLVHSGNKYSTSYEAASLAEARLMSLRVLLEGLAEKEEELEHGILQLRQALYGLGRSLRAKLALAFPFSLN